MFSFIRFHFVIVQVLTQQNVLFSKHKEIKSHHLFEDGWKPYVFTTVAHPNYFNVNHLVSLYALLLLPWMCLSLKVHLK